MQHHLRSLNCLAGCRPAALASILCENQAQHHISATAELSKLLLTHKTGTRSLLQLAATSIVSVVWQADKHNIRKQGSQPGQLSSAPTLGPLRMMLSGDHQILHSMPGHRLDMMSPSRCDTLQHQIHRWRTAHQQNSWLSTISSEHTIHRQPGLRVV